MNRGRYPNGFQISCIMLHPSGGFLSHGGSRSHHWLFQYQISLTTWLIWGYPHDLGNIHVLEIFCPKEWSNLCHWDLRLGVPFKILRVHKAHKLLLVTWCIILPGWWFQTFFIFHILGITIPTDKVIFFRGVGWNHQPDDHIFVFLSPVKWWRTCWMLCFSGWFSPFFHVFLIHLRSLEVRSRWVNSSALCHGIPTPLPPSPLEFVAESLTTWWWDETVPGTPPKKIDLWLTL